MPEDIKEVKLRMIEHNVDRQVYFFTFSLKKTERKDMHSKWDGPFIVASMVRPEACRLRTLEGIEDPYSWNKDMLQKYYV